MGDEVRLSFDAAMQRAAQTARPKRTELVDPAGKPGVVGAFCRAFTPADLCTLLPDQFEPGSTDRRITWLGSASGAPDGVYITTSNTHLHNVHDSAPIGHACNLFDFVRAHLFGELDAGMEQDALDFAGPGGVPSYKAMREWALAMPEVQDEIHAATAVEVVEAQAEAKSERALTTRDDRKQRMDSILVLVDSAGDLETLEHDIGRGVSGTRAFSDTEREVIAQAMQRRTGAHDGHVWPSDRDGTQVARSIRGA